MIHSTRENTMNLTISMQTLMDIEHEGVEVNTFLGDGFGDTLIENIHHHRLATTGIAPNVGAYRNRGRGIRRCLWEC